MRVPMGGCMGRPMDELRMGRPRGIPMGRPLGLWDVQWDIPWDVPSVAIRRPCVAGYTACERLPSLHAFPPSLFLLWGFQDLVLPFCCFQYLQGGSGREVGTPDIPVELAASACAADLMPSNACARFDAKTSILGLPRYPLSALWHLFFVAFGGVGFETMFWLRF